MFFFRVIVEKRTDIEHLSYESMIMVEVYCDME